MPNPRVQAAAEGVPADAAAAAMPDFRKAFDELETKIDRVVGFAQALDYLVVEDLLQKSADRQESFYRLDEIPGEIIIFLAEEAKKAAQDLRSAWVVTHNARCAFEFRTMMDGAR